MQLFYQFLSIFAVVYTLKKFTHSTQIGAAEHKSVPF